MSVIWLVESYLRKQRRREAVSHPSTWLTCHACRRVGREAELHKGCTNSPTCALSSEDATRPTGDKA